MGWETSYCAFPGFSTSQVGGGEILKPMGPPLRCGGKEKIYSQLSANGHSPSYGRFFKSPFYSPSQTLYLNIPISGHSLVIGHGHFRKYKLDFSFACALS